MRLRRFLMTEPTERTFQRQSAAVRRDARTTRKAPGYRAPGQGRNSRSGRGLPHVRGPGRWPSGGTPRTNPEKSTSALKSGSSDADALGTEACFGRTHAGNPRSARRSTDTRFTYTVFGPRILGRGSAGHIIEALGGALMMTLTLLRPARRILVTGLVTAIAAVGLVSATSGTATATTPTATVVTAASATRHGLGVLREAGPVLDQRAPPPARPRQPRASRAAPTTSRRTGAATSPRRTAFFHQSMSTILNNCNAYYAGETLGRGAISPKRLVYLWMHSPEHRQVLLSHYAAPHRHRRLPRLPTASGSSPPTSCGSDRPTAPAPTPAAPRTSTHHDEAATRISGWRLRRSAGWSAEVSRSGRSSCEGTR